MAIKIKSGSITDFFQSAKETAREIDLGRKVTPKNSIWVEPEDLAYLLQPRRTLLIQYLRGKKRVLFKDLIKELNLPAVSLNRDLAVLSKYHLVKTYKESNPGHGVRKIVEPVFGDQKIVFRAEI
jgi:hypothetical protein